MAPIQRVPRRRRQRPAALLGIATAVLLCDCATSFPTPPELLAGTAPATARHDLACFSDGACVAVLEDINACRVATRSAAGEWTSIGSFDEERPCSRPKIACSEPDGARVCGVVFVQPGGDNVRVFRSTDGGLTWGDADRLRSNTNLDNGLKLDWDITCSPQDRCFVSAINGDGNQGLQWRSEQTSGSWRDLERVIPGDLNSVQMDTACSPGGETCLRVFVAFMDSPGHLVYSQRSEDIGQSWSEPAPLALSEQTATIDANNRRFENVAVACPTSTLCHVFATATATDSTVVTVEVSTSTDGGIGFAQPQAIQEGQEPATACSTTGAECVATWQSGAATAAYSFWTLASGWSTPTDLPPPQEGLAGITGPRVRFAGPDALLSFVAEQAGGPGVVVVYTRGRTSSPTASTVVDPPPIIDDPTEPPAPAEPPAPPSPSGPDGPPEPSPGGGGSPSDPDLGQTPSPSVDTGPGKGPGPGPAEEKGIKWASRQSWFTPTVVGASATFGMCAATVLFAITRRKSSSTVGSSGPDEGPRTPLARVVVDKRRSTGSEVSSFSVQTGSVVSAPAASATTGNPLAPDQSAGSSPTTRSSGQRRSDLGNTAERMPRTRAFIARTPLFFGFRPVSISTTPVQEV